MKPLRTAALAAALALSAGAASAQMVDYSGGINAMFAQQSAQMNAQMNSMLGGIMQQNMNDPNVIAAYNQRLASGQPVGSLQDFAYGWAATGGYSAAGMQNYMNTSNQIVGQYQNAYNGYMANNQNVQQAFNGYHQGFSDNQYELGNTLMGNSTYNSPYGQGQVLPHTWQPNTVQTYQNQTYYVDPSGQYWQADPNNSGWWGQMGAPR